MAQETATEPLNQPKAKLKLRRTSISHKWYEEEYTTMVRGIVSRFVWQPSGTTVEPPARTTASAATGYNDSCYVQSFGRIV